MSESTSNRTIFRVLNKVPGYAGYRDKENRRDADRAVRDQLAAELGGRAERIERIAGRLADQRKLSEVGPVSGFASSVRHLRDRINTATYGYGGLFGQRDVDAAVLDQIKLFDESLFAGIDQIDAAVAGLEQAAAGGDVAVASTAGQRVVDEVAARLDLRDRMIESAVPATPAQMSNVMTVLQTPEQQKEAASPPPAYDLHDRDALAVLGDNFVVDARIDIESAAGAFRIFRVDIAPDRWLLVPKTRGQSFALLQATNEPYVSGPPATIGSDQFTIESSGTGNGDVVGVGGQSGRRAVAYTLLRGTSVPTKRAIVLRWGTEQQILLGTDVHPDDVEIFGKPS